MRKLLLLASLVFIIILAHASISSAENLIENPGFETGTGGSYPGWTSYTAGGTAGAVRSADTNAVHSGVYGLWVYTGSEATAYWSGPYQEFSATVGTVYSAQGYGRTPPGQPWVAGSRALIAIQFLNASKGLIKGYGSNAIKTADSGWQLLSVTTPKAPSGTAYVRIILDLQKPQVTGQSIAAFDDISLSISSVPQLATSVGAIGFGETKSTLTFTITNNGATATPLNWSIAKDANWLTISPASGTTTTGAATISVSVTRAGRSQDQNYSGTLQITSDGGNKSIPVYMETSRSYTVPTQPSVVSIVGKTLYVQRRMPNGTLDLAKPFIVKGVGWSPASIGSLGDGATRAARRQEFSNWYELDIAMLKAMNANTVYTFIDFGTDSAAFAILDELYRNGIYAIVTVDWDGWNDTANITSIVNAYKNHPAVLMWAIGNEWNINFHHTKGTASPKTIDQAAADTQASALQIKGLDTGHPVTSIYGEIIMDGQPLSKTATIVNTTCPAVDIWGLNIYRGDNFGDLFTQWASITSKPMFLSEFGADSYFTMVKAPVTGYEDETPQTTYITSQWQDIVPELSALDQTKVCLGGTVFEWNDEWWKVRTADGGSPTVQDNNGFSTITWNPTAQPDGFANEEYFGVVTIDRTPKLAYAALKQAFGTNILYADFPDHGIYKYSGSTWTGLHNISPARMAAAGTDLYVAFSNFGLFKYDGSTWTGLHNLCPTSIAACGTNLYAAFPGVNGIFKWNGSAWSQVSTIYNPTIMVCAGTNLYAAITDYGLYKYNGTTWSGLHNLVPVKLTAAGSDLYAAFTNYGLFKYDGASWSGLHNLMPTSIAACGTDLYAAFTGYDGIFKWNGFAWSQVSTTYNPTIMVCGDTDLYAAITSYGTYKYDGSAWTGLHYLVPASMAAAGSN